MTFRLFYTILKPEPVLKPRSLWRFWSRDEIGMTANWSNVDLKGLTEKQAAWLRAGLEDPDLKELIFAVLGVGNHGLGTVAVLNENGSVPPVKEAKGPPQFTPWRPRNPQTGGPG